MKYIFWILLSMIFKFTKSQDVKINTFYSSNNSILHGIHIGNQVWANSNSNVTNFQNGDPIPHAKSKEEWAEAGIKKQPAWCYPDGDSAIGQKYGLLYNWYAINDQRGLASLGWHVPSIGEWLILMNYWEPKSEIISPPNFNNSDEYISNKQTNRTDISKETLKSNNYKNFFNHYKHRDKYGIFNVEFDYSGWWSSSTNQNEYPIAIIQNTCIACDYSINTTLSKNTGLYVRFIKD